MALISLEAAHSIINSAKAGGYYDEPIPEDREEALDLASYFVNEARKYLTTEPAKARRDNTIKEILNIASSFEVDSPEKYDNLPVPIVVRSEPSQMPIDITSVADRDLRKLHGEYGSFLGRARWLLANAQTDLNNVTYLKDNEYRSLYLACQKELLDEGVKATRDHIDSLAKTDPKYKTYELEERQYQEKVNKLKALVEIYSGNVERLSREWTMRQNEWERSR